jgi:hypothetical protein
VIIRVFFDMGGYSSPVAGIESAILQLCRPRPSTSNLGRLPGGGCAARNSLLTEAPRQASEHHSPRNQRHFPNFASQAGFFSDFSTTPPTLRGFIAL